ncbi:MAG TPA: hypothetical protein ENK91_00430 [Bacteroidetes bacterium]|nr:hypothetical protein [Bacteroidota bacterium]
MKIITFLLALFFLQGCVHKPIMLNDPIEPEPPKDYLWRVPIFSDTAQMSTGGISQIYDNNKLISNITSWRGDNRSMALFDIDQRKKLWQWDDYFPDMPHRITSDEVEGSLMYLNSGIDQYCVDLNTGQTVWKHLLSDRVGSFTSKIGSKIFHVQYWGIPSSPYKATIYMADISTGDWHPIYTTLSVDDYGASIEPPEGYIDSAGDTILFFQNGAFRHESSPYYSTSFFAYNLTKQEMLWEKKDFSHEISNASPPIVDKVNKRIYFLTRHAAYCWNSETGEEVWHTILDYTGVLGSGYLLYNDKIVTKADQGHLLALDAKTGDQVYFVKQGGCCIGRMRAGGNRFYYTDQSLYIANINTGELIMSYYGDDWGFTGGVALDEENKIIYTLGNHYLYAIKDPD